MSGRLGDFIHCMYVPFANFKSTGTKCVVYITDNTKYGGDKFAKTLQQTYSELKPIIEAQEYIESFSIYNGEKFDVNLNEFRRVIYGRGNWVELLARHFNVPIYKELWINPLIKSLDPLNPQNSQINLSDTIVIHRNMTYRDRINLRFNPMLKEIMEKKKCIFLTTEQHIYDDFCRQMKVSPEQIPSYPVTTLAELVMVIGNCRYYIGNQTSPTAFAAAMYRPMLCESMVLRHVYAFEDYYSEFSRITRTTKNNNYLELIK